MFVELRQIPSGDVPPLEQSTRVMNPETSCLSLVFFNTLNSVNMHCNSQRKLKISSF